MVNGNTTGEKLFQLSLAKVKWEPYIPSIFNYNTIGSNFTHKTLTNLTQDVLLNLKHTYQSTASLLSAAVASGAK